MYSIKIKSYLTFLPSEPILMILYTILLENMPLNQLVGVLET